MDDGSFPRERERHGEILKGLDVPLDSPAVRRLIEEVRAETVDVARSYNRTFNRHNR